MGEYSGFDHRIADPVEALKVINFKLEELKIRFPDFDLNQHPGLNESPFSIDKSVVQMDGRKYSSIFLTHLYFYLRTTSFLKPGTSAKRVLEIGSGYGALARIYKTLSPGTTYVLMDLPESLFYSQTFLTSSFPGAKTKYIDSSTPFDLQAGDYDFVFVPVQHCAALKAGDFDLVINTGSLQEMPDDTVRFWMQFIQETIRAKLFYSWNYFLNNKQIYSETGLQNINLICPILDPWWNVKYFRINDPVITVDCDGRNWLEVCVERFSAADRKNTDPVTYGKKLFARCGQIREGTNPWFASLWMAIWCDPRPEYTSLMLKGIDSFAKGRSFGVVNHLDNRMHLYPDFRSLAYFTYRTLRSILRNFLSRFSKRFKYIKYDPRNEYGEVRFYEKLSG